MTKEKDLLAELKSSHTPSAIKKRFAYGIRHSYLKDFIYGAIDGVVTTFAIVAGVAGANLSTRVVIILGIANLIGDGFSMAVSNFLGTRADEELRRNARKTEELHIQEIPEGEREEIRQIFAAKGFKGHDLEKVVNVITSNPNEWVNMMLKEELGMSLKGPSPFKAALATFSAFVFVGALPLFAFFYQGSLREIQLDPFMISTLMTAMAFFSVGALKARFVDQRWYLSGFETFFIGSCAAILAYFVGILLRDII